MTETDTVRGNGHLLIGTTVKGRKLIFTPERIEQIHNLMERGLNRQQIAEAIGCTVGTLQVTCSRLGISLRQSTYKQVKIMESKSNGNDRMDKSPPIVLQEQPSPMTTPPELKIAIRMSYRSFERTIDIPMTSEMLAALAIEAEFANMQISELIVKIVQQEIAKLCKPKAT
jgi:hypothetical protein